MSNNKHLLSWEKISGCGKHTPASAEWITFLAFDFPFFSFFFFLLRKTCAIVSFHNCHTSIWIVLFAFHDGYQNIWSFLHRCVICLFWISHAYHFVCLWQRASVVRSVFFSFFLSFFFVCVCVIARKHFSHGSQNWAYGNINSEALRPLTCDVRHQRYWHEQLFVGKASSMLHNKL